MFNKNRKICTSATAIIFMSLSSLPLNVGGDGHTSAFLLFSTEPVFAQLSRQSIPYGEEQIPTRPSSSSSASTMDFGLFMDSIANSIFNGTSTFAGVGTSIVDGIDVSGISLDKSQNKLSVMLSRTATTQVEGDNNNITTKDTTITALSSLQIGSSTLIDVDWSEPQTVTMDLAGSGTTNQEQEQQINSANATMAEIVLVSVIPYTGVGNNTTSSAT